MIIDNTSTTSIGNMEGHAYKINMSSGIFRIMIHRLYKNPCVAIIREIVSNAYDAQIRNGTENIPIEITPPSAYNPKLVIKDCGIGMSKDDLLSKYSTMFYSDKTETNNELGVYGLGAKTPLLISEQFTVTTTRDGLQTSALIYMDKDIPKIAIITEQKTNSHSGTEIQIPVENLIHITEISLAIENELLYFNTDKSKPITRIIKGEKFEIINEINGVFIKLGPILYKLDYYTRKGIIIFDDLKTTKLEITPNKEQLILSPKCKEYIDELLKEAKKEYQEIIEKISEKDDIETRKTLFILNNITDPLEWYSTKLPCTDYINLKGLIKSVYQCTKTRKGISYSPENTPTTIRKNETEYKIADSTDTPYVTRITCYDTIVVSNTKKIPKTITSYSNFKLIISKTPQEVYDIIKEVQPNCDVILQTAPPVPKREKDPTIRVRTIEGCITNLPINYNGFYILITKEPKNFQILPIIYNNTHYKISNSTLGELYKIYSQLHPNTKILLVPPKYQHLLTTNAIEFIPYACIKIQEHIDNNKEKFTEVISSYDLATSYTLQWHANSAPNSELWRLLAEEKTKTYQNFTRIPECIKRLGIKLPDPIEEKNDALEAYRPLANIGTWANMSTILNKIK